MFAPAARVTDMHTCPLVNGLVPHVGGPILPPGHPMTLIAGLPAARLGDFCVCVGPPDTIATGSFTVLIGGKPAARQGDMTVHGGLIVMGAPNCMIGDSGSGSGGPQAAAFGAARAGAQPFVEARCDAKAAEDEPLAKPDPTKTSWIEIEMHDEDGAPAAHERFRVTAPDGVVHEGFLDDKGFARVEGIDPGTCKVTFPELDKDAWDPAEGGASKSASQSASRSASSAEESAQ